MRILMSPKISNFTLRASNNARKILAKKLVQKVEGLKKDFYEEGRKVGTREEFLSYVWKFALGPQMGYSFSTIHSHAYSIIGFQEAWLATQYNPLYWNCACLSVNAGSAETDFDDYSEGDEEAEEDVLEPYEQTEEAKKKAAVTNYGKIAKALGDIRSKGIKIELPHINKAQADFVPDIENDAIVYGLQGIVGMNPDTISTVISNRPYTSLADFLSKVSLTNVQMISLIKSGAFDELEGKSRLYIMDQYLRYYAEQKVAKKPKLTMANYDKALELGVIPQRFSTQIKMTYFKKWIDKHSLETDAAGKKIYTLTDSDEIKFFSIIVENSLTKGKDYDIIPNGYIVKQSPFKKFYDKYCDPLKLWMLTEEAVTAMYEGEIAQKINEWKEKYCKGSLSKWEMDSLSYYYGPHELANVNNPKYKIVNFNSLPEHPVQTGVKKNSRTGVEYPQYDMCRIAGTVLNTDKAKHIVTLLTVYGVVDVKFYKMAFINYNKRISKIDANGKKTVIEGSWFTRGNLLLINGMRKENMFSPRRDFSVGGYNTSVSLITDIKGGELSLKHHREKGE